LAAYPPIELQFNGVTLSMPADTYLVQHPSHYNARCLGILSTGYGGMLIIGDTTLFSYTMIVDVAAGMVGFSPVNAKGCGAPI
ncbi:MAG: hypothetical protein IV100_04010, partial [Myxococcales bacterium]|nr:hypothetical protein [Myxococcales bacterium]